MSEIPTWPKVTNPFGSTSTQLGALDWANLISDYYNGTDISLTNPDKAPVVGTITKYKPEKLAFYDGDMSHYVTFGIDDIDTGANRKIKVRRMDAPFLEDYMVLEGQPTELLNKEIDGDNNTFSNIPYSALVDVPEFVLEDHAITHKSGGGDEIKLDELGTPTDVTTLNATTSAHGLLKKLSNDADEYMDGTGNWTVPPGSGVSALNDLTDVIISSPSTGQVVKYNGTNWVNDTDSTGGGSGAMDDLTDVTITSIAANQLIARNGANTAYVNSLLTNSMITNTTIDLQAKGVKGSGTSLQVLRVNSGASALEWASLDSERTGKALANGNGSTTTFNIAHGLGSTPSYAFVDCSSHAIARTWTLTSTNIVVVFSSAPSSGTNNVIIYWRVIA